jgi:hypothetical protein
MTHTVHTLSCPFQPSRFRDTPKYLLAKVAPLGARIRLASSSLALFLLGKTGSAAFLSSRARCDG